MNYLPWEHQDPSLYTVYLYSYQSPQEARNSHPQTLIIIRLSSSSLHLPAPPPPDITCISHVPSILSLFADIRQYLLTLLETGPSPETTVSSPAAPSGHGHFLSHNPHPRVSGNGRTLLLASLSLADYTLSLFLKPLSRALGPSPFLPTVMGRRGEGPPHPTWPPCHQTVQPTIPPY